MKREFNCQALDSLLLFVFFFFAFIVHVYFLWELFRDTSFSSFSKISAFQVFFCDVVQHSYLKVKGSRNLGHVIEPNFGVHS